MPSDPKRVAEPARPADDPTTFHKLTRHLRIYQGERLRWHPPVQATALAKPRRRKSGVPNAV